MFYRFPFRVGGLFEGRATHKVLDSGAFCHNVIGLGAGSGCCGEATLWFISYRKVCICKLGEKLQPSGAFVDDVESSRGFGLRISMWPRHRLGSFGIGVAYEFLAFGVVAGPSNVSGGFH